MARTWKLTPDQYEKFEAAATSPHSERRGLFQSMATGAITRDEFEQELAKLEARCRTTARGNRISLPGVHAHAWAFCRSGTGPDTLPAPRVRKPFA
jgi:hypothetical protein